MATCRHEVFAEQSEMALESFRLLSKLWKTQTRTISIVVEGAGDVFKKKYWEALNMNAARPGRAKIWITDVREPDPEIKKQIMQNTNVVFVNKSLDSDLRTYKNLTADVVFILTGDAVHLRTAGKWLGELEWEKRTAAIFMEKPYDRSYDEAQTFYEAFLKNRDKSSTIFIPFDHYLARIYDFVNEKEKSMSLVGNIREIRFSMTEPNGVEESRKDSVKLGMIYDMFCHQLAVISELFNINHLKFEKVLAAKHKDSPIGEADTFAYLECLVPDGRGSTVSVTGCIGKGIGKKEAKYFAINGEDGTLLIDLSGKRKITLLTDDKSLDLYDVNDGHRVILDKLLQGEYMDHPAGALSHKNSLVILRKIKEAREISSGPALPTYQVGEDESAVLARLKVSK